jgi:uncharacterized protein YciI
MTEPASFESIAASLASHQTFVVFALTLPAWRSPATDEGREMLHQHYVWADQVRARGSLLFAGPLDPEHAGPGASPVGKHTGMLVFRASSKEEAEAIAHQDPFHVAGYRVNTVHSWPIRFVQPDISTAIGQAIATPLR